MVTERQKGATSTPGLERGGGPSGQNGWRSSRRACCAVGGVKQYFNVLDVVFRSPVMHFSFTPKKLRKRSRNSLLQEPPACKCVCEFRTVQMSCCSQVEDGGETRAEENERSLSGRVLSSCVEPITLPLSKVRPLPGICSA